jgi:hypothetical protein
MVWIRIPHLLQRIWQSSSLTCGGVWLVSEVDGSSQTGSQPSIGDSLPHRSHLTTFGIVSFIDDQHTRIGQRSSSRRAIEQRPPSTESAAETFSLISPQASDDDDRRPASSFNHNLGAREWAAKAGASEAIAGDESISHRLSRRPRVQLRTSPKLYHRQSRKLSRIYATKSRPAGM